jgi:hypothetical protein
MLQDSLPSLIAAAQQVYDNWQQVDGFDEEFGAGGICQEIASNMSRELGSLGCEHVLELFASVGENHVFLVALLDDGVYQIDIPPAVYETGSGYTWKKRDHVRFTPDHFDIFRVADGMSPEDFFRMYADAL